MKRGLDRPLARAYWRSDDRADPAWETRERAKPQGWFSRLPRLERFFDECSTVVV
jgi:hypothetical protein